MALELTCGVTLSLAFVGFYLYDVRQFNNEVESRLEKTQQLMLDNIAPLLEQNPHATDLQLNLLGVDGQIAAAAVYSTDGKILARYVRAGLTEVIPPLPRVTRLLAPSREDLLIGTPVSRYVNSVQHDDAACLAPPGNEAPPAQQTLF